MGAVPEGYRDIYQDRIRAISNDPYSDDETASYLCLPQRTYESNRIGKPMLIKRKNMVWLARVWSTFLLCNIAPSSHQSDVRMPYCHLLYSIMCGDQIDIAQIISDEIHSFALSKAELKGIIKFPALITALCVRSKVKVRPTEAIIMHIDDAFIQDTIKEEQRERTIAQPAPGPAPPAPDAAPAQPPPPPPQPADVPTTLANLPLMMEHLLLQNAAIMRGMQHQQDAAYTWAERHYPQQHGWLAPSAFSAHVAWPGDRPTLPEEGRGGNEEMHDATDDEEV